jgi:LysM repeat protein
MRFVASRMICYGLAACLVAACQRTLIPRPTEAVPPTGLIVPTAERSATVAEISGTVETRGEAAARWSAASAGLVLGEGSQIRTGTGSRALVRLTEGSKIRLGPDTSFTFTLLNPFLENRLTSLALDKGELWVLLADGALDVETPLGLAAARGAYMSVAYDAGAQSVSVSCLQGTCSFGSLFIPSSHKLVGAERGTASPEPMDIADYGAWGHNVPEATQLAFYATEAVVQGSATLPVVATATVTSPISPTPTATATTVPTSTDGATPGPDRPTLLPPSPTPRTVPPTPTRVPPTPVPPAPIIGQHRVLGGETIFCIGRVYGVLPAAIAQANGLRQPFVVFPGQVLRIPAVQWRDIGPGPVCPPQFQSPFPGLPVAPTAPPVSATPAGAPLAVTLSTQCLANCDSQDGSYLVRFYVTVSGGVPPYTYSPGQTFDLTFPHCVTQRGVVTVTSADGQTASRNWEYVDVSCPPAP